MKAAVVNAVAPGLAECVEGRDQLDWTWIEAVTLLR